MTAFQDASAIVKQYVPEVGSEAVRALDTRIVVSDLSAVEVPSAIWAKQRRGEITLADAGVLVSAFGFDLHGGTYQPPRFASIALRVEVLDRAAGLVAQYGLRAGDAIQLASALVARESLEFCDTFVVFDPRLRNAAAAEGFALVPDDTEMEPA